MLSIYQDRPVYDNRPDHIHWSVNDVPFAPIQRVAGQRFAYDYRFAGPITFDTFGTEVERAAQKLYERHGKPLAICISGRDSEVIARAVAKLGIPARLYYLRLWGINDWLLPYVEAISTDTGLELVTVYLERDHFFLEVMLKSFAIMNVFKPTYLCLPHLFNNIPAGELIVVGEGDVSKDNEGYAAYFQPGQRGLPILSTEIAYRAWAQANARHGEFYFHASTPGLILSAYTDPLVEFAPPKVLTERMYRRHWSNLRFDIKTDNWERRAEINTFIIKRLRNLRAPVERNIGCLIPQESFDRGIGNENA